MFNSMKTNQYSHILFLLITSLVFLLVGTGTTSVSTQFALGQKHTLMIKSDGTLWSWGENSIGQLGIGSNDPRHYPVQIGVDRWSAVTAGHYHSVAIHQDGTLWTWGGHMNGALGNGGAGNIDVPMQISTDLWRSIVSKGAHTIAIKQDGTLWG
ncbi:MAG: hypothetical protein COB71_08260 [Thiotrichales bacterium]|nr:MAG: hypothetical protein COB71_08260 [Thiotrichales bacterium]